MRCFPRTRARTIVDNLLFVYSRFFRVDNVWNRKRVPNRQSVDRLTENEKNRSPVDCSVLFTKHTTFYRAVAFRYERRIVLERRRRRENVWIVYRTPTRIKRKRRQMCRSILVKHGEIL